MAGVYLDRAAWGARTNLPRLGRVVPRHQFTGLAVHHTVIRFHGDVGHYMRALQTARRDLGLDVPYSFVVFNGPGEFDYTVAEGRGFDRTGAHTQGNNSSRYGVALAGDYTNVAPTIGQLLGVRWVGSQLVDPVRARPTIGHRDVHSTACPGAMAYPLLDRLQPPFINPPEPAAVDIPPELLESDTMFQLFDTANNVIVFVPGQRGVRISGNGEAHNAIAPAAPVYGPVSPGSLAEFTGAWDASL